MTLEERIEAEIKELNKVADIYFEDGAISTSQERRAVAQMLQGLLKAHRKQSE